jgi:hypothetical protein
VTDDPTLPSNPTPANVIAIDDYVDEDTVEALKSLLQSAEDGEIVGVHVVANFGGGSRCVKSGHWDRPKLLFALEMAKFRLMEEVLDEGSDAEEDDDGGA